MDTERTIAEIERLFVDSEGTYCGVGAEAA
jgi:hypothetical protein